MLVPRPDDDTFTAFFKTTTQKENKDAIEITIDDLDVVTRNSHDLLVLKKNVNIQRRHRTSRNPVKALAARSDLLNEYTEKLTGVAEREARRLNVEKRK